MMQVSNRTHHALRLLSKLACWTQPRPCPLDELAEEIKISLSYAEILARDLREAGFIVAKRGPGGGYVLRRHPSDITLLDVAKAVDEPEDDAFLAEVRLKADIAVVRFTIDDIMYNT